MEDEDVVEEELVDVEMIDLREEWSMHLDPVYAIFLTEPKFQIGNSCGVFSLLTCLEIMMRSRCIFATLSPDVFLLNNPPGKRTMFELLEWLRIHGVPSIDNLTGPCYRIRDYRRFNPNDLSSTIDEIMAGGPVIMIFKFDDGFANTRPGDVYKWTNEYASRSDTSFKLHAVCVIGGGTDAGQEFFTFLNTHRITYGENGIGRVSASFVTEAYSLRIFD